MAHGKFITLEGGEGAGKSTQSKILADFLRKHGIKVVLTREVGGSTGAEEIRKLWLSQNEGYWDPLAELFLIFAARREHLTRTIWPALKKGTWVICDRFIDSTYAYQGDMKDQRGHKTVNELYHQIAGQFEPDLTLLLDLPVSTSMSRVKARGGWNDRYQLKGPAFHRKLRQAYMALARKHSKRINIIDAQPDTNEVARLIQAAVIKHFKLKARK